MYALADSDTIAAIATAAGNAGIGIIRLSGPAAFDISRAITGVTPAARHARVTLVHRESAAGGERLSGANPEKLSNATVKNEDTLGIFTYDPVTVALPG